MGEGASSTVRVYDYELYDKESHSWRVADRMGTLDAIASVGGIPLRASMLVVDRERLDETGFLVKSRFVV